MPQTLAEKIIASHTEDGRACAGDIVDASVDLIMVHEVLGSRIIPILEEMAFDKVWDPERVLVVNDHWAPPPDTESAQIHIRNRQFVKEQGIKHFCDVECGICHQVLAEEGLALPGMLIIGSDSHSTTYGAFNAFSAGLAATDSAMILATGKIWLRVPEALRIDINGELPKRVMSKDLMLKIVTDLGTDGANYQSMEFFGSLIDNLSVGSRMTMCNMTVESGAKCGIMPVNRHVEEWIKRYAPEKRWKATMPDVGAEYIESLSYEVNKNSLEPMVAKPHSPANSRPIPEIGDIEIDQAFIGSCTNGRLEDLSIAAQILRGNQVHQDTRLIITPASRATYIAALKDGIIEILLESGAIVTNSTCGACIGGHLGVLGPNEVCISSTNRNFQGRMGDPTSIVYLASPATVAASAITGRITDPREV
ncbi:MAG: 3-isopropylmalate dehydratase large subunit [Candidatus Thorarchaeota archaeon]